MLDGLSLDPYVVLGVARDATAEQIREAFRRKSKKYHPDAGGDDWAFKIVARAYEALCTATGRAAAAGPAEAPDTGRIRPGLHDKNVDPAHTVLVEVLWMRYEVEDVLELLAPRAAEDRHLSGSLTITWPDAPLAGLAATIPGAEPILRALNAAFDEARARPQVRGARSQIDGGRFEAMLSYASGAEAWAAFKALHVGLKARGLGVRQWTRDLAVPRD